MSARPGAHHSPEPLPATQHLPQEPYIRRDPQPHDRRINRLYFETINQIGADPMALTEHVRQITMDPWASPTRLNRYILRAITSTPVIKATAQVPVVTPKVMSRKPQRSQQGQQTQRPVRPGQTQYPLKVRADRTTKENS